MDSLNVPRFFTVGVSPFGNLRVKAYLQLTAAYRSLSRPSSAPDAKAFVLCSSSLELSYQMIFSIMLFSLFELLEFLNRFWFSLVCSKRLFHYLCALIVFHLAVKLYFVYPTLFGKTYTNLISLIFVL